jgi:hypothetical protein
LATQSDFSRTDRHTYNFIEQTLRLDDTIVILMGDHGQKFFSDDDIQHTWLNRQNALNPVLIWAAQRHLFTDAEWAQLASNQQRLVSMFDLHFSLLGIVDDQRSARDPDTKGFDMLHEAIPPKRTCEDAGIQSRFCALISSAINVPESEASWLRSQLIDYINDRIFGHEECLSLRERDFIVTSVEVFEGGKETLSMEQGSLHVAIVQRSENVLREKLKFEGVFKFGPSDITSPKPSSVHTSGAETGSSVVRARRLSRYMYEACTEGRPTALRQFCVCKDDSWSHAVAANVPDKSFLVNPILPVMSIVDEHALEQPDVQSLHWTQRGGWKDVVNRDTPAVHKRLKLDASANYTGRSGAPRVVLVMLSQLIDSDGTFESSEVCSLNRVATQHDSPFRDPNAPNSTVFGPVFTVDPGQVVQISLKAQLVVNCNAAATAPYWSTLFDVARIEFDLKIVEQMSDGTWQVKGDNEAVMEEGRHSALFFSNRRIIPWNGRKLG